MMDKMDKMQDLGGQTLQAVSLEYSPFLTYETGDGSISATDSLDWRMVSTISDILNFKVLCDEIRNTEDLKIAG
jgi:hypothetical protein